MTEEYLQYYRNYIALRPTNMTDRRFFLSYRNGKCCRQVVGIHKFGSIPQEIANYLKLPNAKEYTGHCFRRTSATFLVDAGADITSLKRHGGWKSSGVAEGYIDESINNKLEVAQKILNTSKSNQQQKQQQLVSAQITQSITEKTKSTPSSPNSDLHHPVLIQNCSNCTFNINIVNN